MTKKCSKCLFEKDLDEFSPRAGTNKRMSQCRQCDAKRQRGIRASGRSIGYDGVPRLAIKPRIKLSKSECSKNYDARKKSAKSDIHKSRVLKNWIDSQEKICIWCHCECSSNFHVDHIVPLSRGGHHKLNNLAISCPTCNMRKGAKLPCEWVAQLNLERLRAR